MPPILSYDASQRKRNFHAMAWTWLADSAEFHLMKKARPFVGKTYIKQWREHRHLTQEQLAERVDMSPANLSKLERGKIPYTQGSLEALAYALNVEPIHLLSMDPSKRGEVVLWETYRSLPQEEKERLHSIAEALKRPGKVA